MLSPLLPCCATLDWRVPGGLSVQHSTGVCQEGCLCNTRLAYARRAVCPRATLDQRLPGGLSVQHCFGRNFDGWHPERRLLTGVTATGARPERRIQLLRDRSCRAGRCARCDDLGAVGLTACPRAPLPWALCFSAAARVLVAWPASYPRMRAWSGSSAGRAAALYAESVRRFRGRGTSRRATRADAIKRVRV